MPARRIVCVAALLIGFVLVPPVARAQSVEAVIRQLHDRYEQQFETIDDYIIETDKYTAYYKKTRTGGRPTYKTKTVWKSESGLVGSGAFGSAVAVSPYFAQDEEDVERFIEVATYAGRETVNGRPAHVLVVEDPSVLADEQEETSQTARMGPVTFYIDAEAYVPLRMTFEALVEQHGATHTVAPVITFQDYRRVQGLMVPFRTEMQIENLRAALSDEERAQARAGLAQMEQQLRALQNTQQPAAVQQLKAQMEKLRGILEDGRLHFSVQVQDLRVNTGLSDALFVEDGN